MAITPVFAVLSCCVEPAYMHAWVPSRSVSLVGDDQIGSQYTNQAHDANDDESSCVFILHGQFVALRGNKS
jgi:hypothetical protein